MRNGSIRLQRRSAKEKRSGAAMLIVMLVLLVVTASATMAVYSSQFESRAAGHQRQAMQTAQVAQSGLAAASTTIEMLGGARVLEYQMRQAPIRRNARLSAEEPAMNRGASGTAEGMTSRSQRFSSNEFTIGSGAAGSNTVASVPTDGASFGMTAFEPRFIVDVNDAYNVTATFVGGAAGTRVDGNGTVQLAYLVTTMTSRGRMTRTGVLLPDGTSGAGVFTAAETNASLRRDIFETSVTARATAISGPYAP